jgi:hypothetical protein
MDPATTKIRSSLGSKKPFHTSVQRASYSFDKKAEAARSMSLHNFE